MCKSVQKMRKCASEDPAGRVDVAGGAKTTSRAPEDFRATNHIHRAAFATLLGRVGLVGEKDLYVLIALSEVEVPLLEAVVTPCQHGTHEARIDNTTTRPDR